MPSLSEADRKAVGQLFTGASRDVKVVCFPGTEDAKPFREALDEVATLVPQVTVEERPFRPGEGSVERTPACLLEDGEGHDLGIRFYGLPSGYEFSALLSAVADAASEESPLRQETRDKLAALSGPVRIKVFTTPT